MRKFVLIFLALNILGCGGSGSVDIKTPGKKGSGPEGTTCKATKPSHQIKVLFSFTDRRSPQTMQVRFGLGKDANLQLVYDECSKEDPKLDFKAYVSRLGDRKVDMQAEIPYDKSMPKYFTFEIREVSDCHDNKGEVLIEQPLFLKVKEKPTQANCPNRKVADHDFSFP